MTKEEMNVLVENVTREVMAEIGRRSGESPAVSGERRILYLGNDVSELPAALVGAARICQTEDYRPDRNILRYDRVVIGSLTIGQLVDLALAHVSDDLTCAVLNALLNGVEVYILDAALPYKAFAGKCSTALYQKLEQYAKTLMIYGIRLWNKEDYVPPVRTPEPARFSAPSAPVPMGNAVRNSRAVVTAADAQKMIRQEGPVHLSRQMILTPAAKDVFIRSKKELITE